MTTTDLLARARAGDGDAFRELTAPHQRELEVHSYRMLGSLQDAQDAVQETLLAAWQGLGGFEGKASFRTWLYRIATNRCLNALRAASRRPAKEWDMSAIEPPEPNRYGEITWLEPYPDDRFDSASIAAGPEAHYEQTEAMSLAFITALQLLPARQRAVLILREVLGFRATEVADMLDSTVDSVTSALKRARSALQRHLADEGVSEPLLAPASPVEQALVERFVRAYEAADMDAVVALLTEDVRVSMPPIPFEYLGHDAVSRFLTILRDAGRRYQLVPTHANGQPAFGVYAPDLTARVCHGSGLLVLTLSEDRISAITRFENTALPWFGLPRALPHQPRQAGTTDR